MTLTSAHVSGALKAAGAGSGLVTTTSSIANMFNDAILKYGGGQFTTNNSVAALLSECMMESAYFRTTEEYSKHGRYAPYIGRTFIQITWESNYKKFGAWCKSVGLVSDPNYFQKNPEKLKELKWAAIGGVWYFTKVLFHGKPLTAYTDNIDQVGKAVNLGDPYSTHVPAGQTARRAAYAAVLRQGGNLIPEAPHPVVNPDKTNDTKAKELIMATGTRVQKWNNVRNNLKVGVQDVRIKKDTKDVTIVTGPNAGIDLVAVIEVDNPGLYPIKAYFHVVDWKDGGPNKEVMRGIGVAPVGPTRETITVLYKSDLAKGSGAGRSMRLRLAIEVGAVKVAAGKSAPPLPVFNNVHIDGWVL